MQNKIVVRYLDGRVMKGYTTDFMPNKEFFHLVLMDSAPGAQPLRVHLRECKALFFVKDFEGNPQYQDKKEFASAQIAGGRKIKVIFKDNETLVGTTQGYQPGRPGFFLFPADPESNIERSFVVSAATQKVTFI